MTANESFKANQAFFMLSDDLKALLHLVHEFAGNSNKVYDGASILVGYSQSDAPLEKQQLQFRVVNQNKEDGSFTLSLEDVVRDTYERESLSVRVEEKISTATIFRTWIQQIRDLTGKETTDISFSFDFDGWKNYDHDDRRYYASWRTRLTVKGSSQQLGSEWELYTEEVDL